jgi:hypothetical protein
MKEYTFTKEDLSSNGFLEPGRVGKIETEENGAVASYTSKPLERHNQQR